MQDFKLPKPIPNLLVLIALTCAVLFGWLTGHILRFAFPVLWHPPIEKITPKIQYGFEFKGIRREAVLSGNPDLRILPNEGMLDLEQILLDPCISNTYYTSLPTNCHSVDGKLVSVVGTGDSNSLR